MLNKNCLVLNIPSCQHKHKGIYYVIKEWRAKTCLMLHAHMLKAKSILKSIIEQKLHRLLLQIICTFHYFPKKVHKGVWRSAPKKYLLLYPESDNEFWIHVQQIKFKMTRPFFWDKTKGAGPLNYGSKWVQSL